MKNSNNYYIKNSNNYSNIRLLNNYKKETYFLGHSLIFQKPDTSW